MFSPLDTFFYLEESGCCNNACHLNILKKLIDRIKINDSRGKIFIWYYNEILFSFIGFKLYFFKKGAGILTPEQICINSFVSLYKIPKT